MGTLLDKPITEKHTQEERGGDGLRYGASAMQGWRVEMEDSHTIITNLEGLNGHSFVAVYDGHGGSLCAEYAGKNMMKFIQATQDYKKYASSPAGHRDEQLLGSAMKQAFLDIDAALKEEPEFKNNSDRSGCTALAAFITPTHIVVAHAGDSRAVICGGGEVKLATEDHKPYDAGERNRIEAAGGCVSMKRVDGDLAVSRALGDFQYKDAALAPEKCKVTAYPDTMSYVRSKNDELLVLCCDGIWDVMTNKILYQTVVDIFTEGEQNVGVACEEVLDVCLQRGSRDNMSAVIVAFASLKVGSGPGVSGRRAIRAAEEAKKNEARGMGAGDSSADDGGTTTEPTT